MNAPDAERKGKRFGFPRKARLSMKREFDRVFLSGGKGVAGGLVIFAKENARTWNRLGMAVSRKRGGAVQRNRIRRLIREAFRHESPDLPQGFDFVCIPRAEGFPDRAVDLRPLFRRTALKAIERCGKPGKREEMGRE